MPVNKHPWQIAVTTITVVLLVAACASPRRTTMPASDGGTVALDIRGPLGATERIAANAIRLHESGLVGLRRRFVTDKVFSAELDLATTAALRLYLRTTVHDMAEAADSGLVVTIYGNGRTVMTTPSGTVAMDTPMPATGPLAVGIMEDARWCTVTVGCTTLPSVATSRPATEWVVVQTRSPLAVDIIDPQFHTTYTREH